MTHAFGIELETCGASIRDVEAQLQRDGILGAQVKPDGTPGVDAEIVLPPLADCSVAWQYVASVCRSLERAGCSVSDKCGLHVHISNAPLTTAPSAYTGDSIAHSARSGGFLTGDHFGDPLDAVAVKDIMQRYTAQQDVIDSMLPASRRNNRYCMPLSARQIDAAPLTIAGLQAATRGKFSTVNLQTWTRGTIEFRQHSGTIEAAKVHRWAQFVLNLVTWTTSERVEGGTRTIEEQTPEQPFRRNSRVGIQYTMMRSENGATTRDIMLATGCSEQRVRAAVSEIRARVGDAAVITHTQQAQGARYGDGTDLTRYQVQTTWTREENGATLRPENRRGGESIWSGLPDELFEAWQTRIEQIARRR